VREPAASSAASADAVLAAQACDDCQNAQGLGVAACAARRQFSCTVNSGKMVVRW
jgi:hypothetical protein